MSSEFNSYWGDYARTFIISDGNVLTDNELIQSQLEYDLQFVSGINTEKKLHRIFMEYVTPSKTFEDVYLYLNEIINQYNYKNLDFAGNLGHTIEFNKDNRQYFEIRNKTKLGDVAFFTFEPHIQCINGRFGFKREDIYYFRNGTLCVL